MQIVMELNSFRGFCSLLLALQTEESKQTAVNAAATEIEQHVAGPAAGASGPPPTPLPTIVPPPLAAGHTAAALPSHYYPSSYAPAPYTSYTPFQPLLVSVNVASPPPEFNLIDRIGGPGAWLHAHVLFVI